ncbi:hypothetical protein H696_01165 [Fonticula alba]|uniref:Adenosinetriphosphatase n=1 Tax=Fonticula alba TaxID=691883 RepID=A0A058ZBG7_FONAL|nr:hypothetical protein H696_01165 [Fonticula alba]KCV71744.1 hypothetical protein H696_01165 [Fonticula alba]|eukprot:XP_009493322.1 hypothetical protein H696_01165 [Fonticula alba]
MLAIRCLRGSLGTALRRPIAGWAHIRALAPSLTEGDRKPGPGAAPARLFASGPPQDRARRFTPRRHSWERHEYDAAAGASRYIEVEEEEEGDDFGFFVDISNLTPGPSEPKRTGYKSSSRAMDQASERIAQLDTWDALAPFLDARLVALASAPTGTRLPAPERHARRPHGLAWATPTPIQRAAIPVVASGQSVIASAQTGTGKTAAFLFPALSRLAAQVAEERAASGDGPLPVHDGPPQPRALLLAPTGPLAAQAFEVVSDWAVAVGLSVGLVAGPHKLASHPPGRPNPELVISTPGALLRSLGVGNLDPRRLALATGVTRRPGADQDRRDLASIRESLAASQLAQMDLDTPWDHLQEGADQADSEDEELMDPFSAGEENETDVAPATGSFDEWMRQSGLLNDDEFQHLKQLDLAESGLRARPARRARVATTDSTPTPAVPAPAPPAGPQIDLSRLDIFLIDECDRMLSLGLLPSLFALWKFIPRPSQRKVQTLLFSATLPESTHNSLLRFAPQHELVHLNDKMLSPEQLKEYVYDCGAQRKMSLLLYFLRRHRRSHVTLLDRKTMVYVRSRVRAERVAAHLRENGVRAVALHSKVSAAQQRATLARFAPPADGSGTAPPPATRFRKAFTDDGKSEIDVMVVTDVLGRGIDLPNVEAVVNLDLPLRAEDYVHRVGRTARGDRSGLALTFVSPELQNIKVGTYQTTRSESATLQAIETMLRRRLPRSKVPGPWLDVDSATYDRLRGREATPGPDATASPVSPANGKRLRPKDMSSVVLPAAMFSDRKVASLSRAMAFHAGDEQATSALAAPLVDAMRAAAAAEATGPANPSFEELVQKFERKRAQDSGLASSMVHAASFDRTRQRAPLFVPDVERSVRDALERLPVAQLGNKTALNRARRIASRRGKRRAAAAAQSQREVHLQKKGSRESGTIGRRSSSPSGSKGPSGGKSTKRATPVAERPEKRRPTLVWSRD